MYATLSDCGRAINESGRCQIGVAEREEAKSISNILYILLDVIMNGITFPLGHISKMGSHTEG